MHRKKNNYEEEEQNQKEINISIFNRHSEKNRQKNIIVTSFREFVCSDCERYIFVLHVKKKKR